MAKLVEKSICHQTMLAPKRGKVQFWSGSFIRFYKNNDVKCEPLASKNMD